jgi:regulator of RNase E activity RraB
MKAKSLDEVISGHEARDAALLRLFSERKVDAKEPRLIECHFWVWSEEKTGQLATALKSRGFEILEQRSAPVPDDPNRWNLEAAIRQSPDLTMRREFMEDMVRLADSYGGEYDGWGTVI